MKLQTLVTLGRVSNLPTVWTNTLAALSLVGAPFQLGRFLVAGVAMSLMYTGGMFLNDAFDREIDARERPERPIPSGQISAPAVFWLAFAQLLFGVVLVGSLDMVEQGQPNPPAIFAALGLASLIVLYDLHHKKNPLSPLLMGLCRVGVYITVGLLFVPLEWFDPAAIVPIALLGGAGLLLGYLIGLTYVAKQENLGSVKGGWPLVLLAGPLVYGLSQVLAEPPVLAFIVALFAVQWWAIHLLRQKPPRIPQAVVTLIAGIALVDALLMAAVGRWLLGIFGVLGFLLTLGLQRWVRGT